MTLLAKEFAFVGFDFEENGIECQSSCGTFPGCLPGTSFYYVEASVRFLEDSLCYFVK